MFKFTIIAFTSLLLLTSAAPAQDATPPADADTQRPTWERDADARNEQLRKGEFTLTLTGPDGKPLANTPVTLDQTRHHFMFGSVVGGFADHPGGDHVMFRSLLKQHFNTIVMENDMKWSRIEPERDVVVFDKPDLWVAWAKENDFTMRGHGLFWAKFGMVQDWVKALPEPERREEALEHLRETVAHFKGNLYCWDVNNEMMNGNYFVRNVGENLRPDMFEIAHEIDPDVQLFVNEYGILDDAKKTDQLIAMIKELQEQGAPIHGIGLQEHRAQAINLSGQGDKYTPELFLANLDKLAELGLPIHFTEITSRAGKDEEKKGRALEALYRIGFSHPSVECILLWGFYDKRHWKGAEATLTNKDGSLKPSGKILFDLIEQEWMTHDLQATTDAQGRVTFRGFYGTYDMKAGDASAMVKLTPDQPDTTARLAG